MKLRFTNHEYRHREAELRNVRSQAELGNEDHDHMYSWQIHELTHADYEPVMALWNATPGVRATETPEEFARILARNPGLSCVARDGDQLVAAILCCHDGRRGYLYHLAVAQSHRRQGIARAMVDRCLALLTKLGIARCTLFVVADNEDGAAFWKHAGWRERVDLKAMAKDLL